MRVACVILATTTTSQIGTSAPSAREGSTPLPWVPLASKHVSNVRLARGRRRAVQPARSVLHIPIQLADQLSSQIAPAILEQQGVECRAGRVIRKFSTLCFFFAVVFHRFSMMVRREGVGRGAAA